MTSTSLLPVPTLDVRRFFPGAAVGVVKAFRDFDGQNITTGEVFHIADISTFPYDDGITLRAEKTIRLSGNVDENVPIIENRSNQYFEPLPVQGCVLACLGVVNSYWLLPEVANSLNAAEIRADLDRCLAWLTAPSGELAPVFTSAEFAVGSFLMQPALQTYIPLCFALAQRCPPTRTSACSE